MPTLAPSSIEELRGVIRQHRDHLVSRTYDLSIRPGWVKGLDEDLLWFLLENCPNTHVYLAGQTDNPRLLERLAAQADDRLDGSVVRNPHCPADVLRRYSQHMDLSILLALWDNPSIPQDLIPFLADRIFQSADHDAIRKIASDRRTPAALLRHMAEHSGAAREVAGNPNVPRDLVELLALNERSEVRAAIARNPRCSGTILRRLVEIGGRVGSGRQHQHSPRTVGRARALCRARSPFFQTK